MTGIILTRRDASTGPIDASELRFERFTDLAADDIARLTVLVGRDRVALGDVFTVTGSHSSTVLIEGALSDVHGLGNDLSSGELVVAGNAGNSVGAAMSGGRIRILGNVGHDAGMAMRGGVLRVDGNAGDRLGAALPGARRGMSGGEILVSGSAGAEVGTRARRGLIAIGGNAGSDLARDIIAGTVVVGGSIGSRVGAGSKRGTVIAAGSVAVPSTYCFACTYEPPVVRLVMTYLVRHHEFDVPERIVTGRYHRYCGEAGAPGRGEILQWVAP
jgi:formylmethanofuran dehydrogenase subunit C